MQSDEFLQKLAVQLAHQLRPNDAIKQFTGNSDIIGQYAEESVRELVRKTVAPLRVSTGAVLDLLTVPDDKLPQLDTIVWTPSPSPAIFESGHFGLIPKGSSMGILEIKRSDYRGVTQNLEERLNPDRVRHLVAESIAGEQNERLPALGVICIREHPAKGKHNKLDQLIEQRRVVVLFDRVGNELRERTKDICELINFLAYVRMRARLHDGAWRITYGGQ
jgi:hypothetical protein